ncbi:MAG: hypothetical protein OQK98_14330 [Gammaproteobacteria bacterium]|nr:hypothetical protein [Gammaproteobacteria bacterium]
MPIRNIPETTHDQTNISLGKVAVTGCERDFMKTTKFDFWCEEKSLILRNTLLKTNLFSEIVKNKDDADYHVFITKDLKGPTLFYLQGNSIEYLWITLVLPVWENYDYGYNFKITNTRTNESHQLDTTDNGSQIFWSGSLLLNLQSDRGFSSTFKDNEIQYLRNTILNTVL